MLGKYKNLIIAVVVIIIGFVAYSMFFVSNEPDDLLTVTGPASVQILGQDIVRNLNKIDALELDAGVLDHPVMRNLRDFSDSIQDQRSGRDNPFLPYENPIFSSEAEVSGGLESSDNFGDTTTADQSSGESSTEAGTDAGSGSEGESSTESETGDGSGELNQFQ
jgi:hypothetical protein